MCIARGHVRFTPESGHVRCTKPYLESVQRAHQVPGNANNLGYGQVFADNKARVPVDLPLRCRCGHVHGVASEVAPSTGFRFVCYCTDCQAFALFLDRPDVLDAAGGTDIFQMPMGRVKLSAGTGAMRCVRFSSKVLRWYTDCCRTPVGNTAAGPGFPVVGLIHSFMTHEPDGHSRNEVLGLPLCRIFERSAIGPLPPDAASPPSLSVFALRGSRLLGWWLRGLGRPTPFFDDLTKMPLSAPRSLAAGDHWQSTTPEAEG